MSELKKVGYECLVGSQVLCEFWDNVEGDGFTGFLTYADSRYGAGRYRSHTDDGWTHCRIYQHPDYWISNAKGDLVLPEGLLINTHRRNGSIDIMLPTEDRPMAHIADYLRFDIMSVQVVRAAEGYEL